MVRRLWQDQPAAAVSVGAEAGQRTKARRLGRLGVEAGGGKAEDGVGTDKQASDRYKQQSVRWLYLTEPSWHLRWWGRPTWPGRSARLQAD